MNPNEPQSKAMRKPQGRKVALASAIALLLLLPVVPGASKKMTRADISNLSSMAESYFEDTGKYPGASSPNDENAFPALFEALFGEKPPNGKGGPNAPYGYIKEHRVVVWDDGAEEYRKASRDEIYDPVISKYWIDFFGMPLVYRSGHSSGVYLYSVGPDRIDQTIKGKSGDDIVAR